MASRYGILRASPSLIGVEGLHLAISARSVWSTGRFETSWSRVWRMAVAVGSAPAILVLLAEEGDRGREGKERF